MPADHERLAIDWFDGKQVPDALEVNEAVMDPDHYGGESEDEGSDVSSDEEDDNGNINDSDKLDASCWILYNDV